MSMQDMDGVAPEAATEFADLFRELGEALDREEMEPDASRQEWPGEAIHKLAKRYDALLKLLPGAVERAADEALASRIADDVALMAGEIALLAHLAGIKSDADRLFRLGLEQAISDPAQAQLRAGSVERAGYAQLVHGFWLSRMGRVGESDKCMKRVRSATKDLTLRELADRFLDRPKPLTGAPALFRMNGFGFGLYGSRDRRPDGTYIATYCASALWVPVFPFTAYRVRDEGGGRITFFSKQRLSRFASGVRFAIPLAIALIVVGATVSSHYNSREYRAGVAFETAQQVEAAGDPTEAISAYEQVTRQWGGTDAARDATGAVLRLMLTELPDPPTLEGVEALTRVLRRASSAGWDLRAQGRTTLRERAAAYTAALGEASEAAVLARLRIVPVERELWQEDEELAQEEQALRVALGDLYREQWPADALHQYASAFPRPDALEHAEACVRRLMTSASCLRESESAVQSFVDAKAGEGVAREASSALAAAQSEATDAQRLEVLSGDDIERLRAAVEERPQDQELLSALVRGEQGPEHGAACERLASLGEPGLLIGEAQVARSSCLREAGELSRAAELLSHHVNVRLPEYQNISSAYDAAARERLERWGRDADQGRFAPELERELRLASRDEQPDIYSRWVRQQLDADPALTAMRERLTRLGEVVPAALRLGMLQLQRAQSETGEARTTLLADAERLLLAIADQASDVPAFHITLGQVYFRLGREEEGARELDAVAAGGDAQLVLGVAQTYRELGQYARARTVARSVFSGGGEEGLRQQAAVLLSMMADDLDASVDWLRRAPGTSPSLEAQRAQTEARKQLRDGDRASADQNYQNALRYWEHEAPQNSTSANNAAVIYGERFQCSGDVRMLHRATQGLERALRLQPSNSIALENLLNQVRYEAVVRAIEPDVRVADLRLGLGEAETLLYLFLRDAGRQRRLARLSRSMARVIDLAKQAEVLAPGRASSYAQELGWYSTSDDQAAMADLARRVEAAPSFADASARSRREQWLAGTLDEMEERRRRAQLAVDDARVAGGTGDAHTLALAHYLRADDHGSLFGVTQDIAELDAQVADYRAALAAWPELPIERDLAWSLLARGLYAVAADNENLRAAIASDRRMYSARWSFHRLLASADGGALRRAVQARPEVREALSLMRSHPSRKPALIAWLLGVDLEDAELAAANEPSRLDALQRTAARIGAKLSPLDLQNAAIAELYLQE